ncbi:DNA-directed RNA polymerase subunit beta' [Brevibacterium samyangense]|uniref:DNA-directed RNA polymerase subunit beta' n=1 Tax=Brevibacterium samyangense TaxID=366888 RepID=A0ABN2TIK7_9MICO
MPDVNFFDELRIGLATAEDIRRWSHGEVKKPETINYRTLKPEKDGLFCERIFGPTRDWECACGKYKRVRFKGIICERCGVEVTRAKVRRERMGHIELAAPVTHIWYFKGVPSRLGYLLDLAPKDLEKVIYFAAYMITDVDEESRHRDMPSLQAQVDIELKQIEDRTLADINRRQVKLEEDLAALEADGGTQAALDKLKTQAEKEIKALRRRMDRDQERLRQVWDRFKSLKVSDLEGDEVLYREMVARFGMYFQGAMGAEALQKRLQDFDLQTESDNLRELIKTGKGQRKTRALKRLKVVNAFLTTDNKPEGMVLDAIPVIPPELRPMVQLDGGRFATSDLNDLYRRVINRNNRLKRLLDLGAPEIIVNNEKRMLQEAVDSLFDNGRRGRPVTGPGNRPLKSLSDMLKGKQGRFRQNLLGKRVDYSGRSVIVVGPTLQLHQCGLPKTMALELFKPFVMKRLVDLNHAQNIKSAKRMVERQHGQVWDVLEEVITEHPVLLNRAPTLHRLGIQAFEPQLIEGKAIQIHPLVCSAFNADFDGDQMAVHLPLSVEAQAEARVLMLSANNILKPSDGKPVTMPSQDMIIGIYHLTSERTDVPGIGRAFSSVAEAQMAFDRGEIDLGAKVTIRIDNVVPGGDITFEDGSTEPRTAIVETTLGRALFNESLPEDYPFINRTVDKKNLSNIVNRLAGHFPTVVTAATLDNFKSMGFYWATRSGLSVAMTDVVSPAAKEGLLDEAEAASAKVQEQFDFGMLTDEERRSELVKIWSETTDKVATAMQENFPEGNSVLRLVESGASGNWTQVRQLAGMRGLVTNPKGEIIPRPIKSNYREGLSVLEYFIASHGARKGLADTALRTADSGYLTRRLVDVSQDVIVRAEGTDSKAGITLPVAQENASGELVPHEFVETSVYGRLTVQDVLDSEGNVLVPAKTEVDRNVIDTLVAAGVTTLKVHSVLTADSDVQISAEHYGNSMATGKLVDIGEAIGTVAAQSIGEPGTQLTMRTFHTGGVAAGGGGDITQGLPRVTELFEARTPKGFGPIAEASGRVKIDDSRKTKYVIVIPDDGGEEVEHAVSSRAKLLVEEGQSVKAGDRLVEGAIDPKQVLRIRGRREAERFLVDEVQKVYRSQGVGIHDKHIEVIVRQMLRRVTVIEPGDTTLLPGELVDRGRYREANQAVVAEGGQPASARDELMGITKASLATESWLSAASFQETTRVLTEAAMEGKSDPLLGLKENVILGKLIPAGTGMHKFRDQIVEPTEEAKAEMFNNSYSDFNLAFSGEGTTIPLEDYDFGAFS